MIELEYSKEIPKEDGWYWLRYKVHKDPGIEESIGHVNKSFKSDSKLVTFNTMTCIADDRFEYAGPIERPIR